MGKRSILTGVAGALMAGLLWLTPASAQTRIVALVNNTPITSTEVAERRAIVRLTQRKEINAQQALEELINQNLLFQDASRRRITIADSEIDQRLNAIAANAKMTPPQLETALNQSGASTRAFRAEIRFGLLQRRYMGMLARRATGVSEREIAAGITAKRSDGGAATAYRFTMQQVVFVVPKGAPSGAVSQRRNEAENLRRRVQSCQQASELARQLRDVAVKPPVVRLSSQLNASFRDELAAMKIGGTTKAETNDSGVEFVILCEKQETQDDTALRSEVQNELATELGKAEMDKHLTDLRRRALVIYK